MFELLTGKPPYSLQIIATPIRSADEESADSEGAGGVHIAADPINESSSPVVGVNDSTLSLVPNAASISIAGVVVSAQPAAQQPDDEATSDQLLLKAAALRFASACLAVEEATAAARKANSEEISVLAFDLKTADELNSAGETAVRACTNKAAATAACLVAQELTNDASVVKTKAIAAHKVVAAAQLVEAAASTAVDAANAAWLDMRTLREATAVYTRESISWTIAATALVSAEKSVMGALDPAFIAVDQAVATVALATAVELRNSALATSQSKRATVEKEAIAVKEHASVSARTRAMAVTAHSCWMKAVLAAKKKPKKAKMRRSGGGGGRRRAKAAPTDAVAMSPDDWDRWKPKALLRTMERDTRFCVKTSTIPGAGDGLFSTHSLEKNTEIELRYTPKIDSEVTSEMRSEFKGMIIETGLNVNLEASEVRTCLPEF